ncbi:MAG: hypothetical protein IPJ19_16495 [Planctomycetes bacterium]|nr:hypothetical protein [Planctomycetota bacterium]
MIPHLFHMIQGGPLRPAGRHRRPHGQVHLGDIQTIADHLHWQGDNP